MASNEKIGKIVSLLWLSTEQSTGCLQMSRFQKSNRKVVQRFEFTECGQQFHSVKQNK